MKDIQILIAAHKECKVPEKKDFYLPILVGAKGKKNIEGFIRDDEKVNISEKNPYYCELTGLFWAWKNLDSDYVGLSHYRRYFTESKKIPKEEDKKFDLFELGYNVYVLKDYCVCTHGVERHNNALEILRRNIGKEYIV